MPLFSDVQKYANINLVLALDITTVLRKHTSESRALIGRNHFSKLDTLKSVKERTHLWGGRVGFSFLLFLVCFLP